jgi:hypothetical protein
MPWSSFFASSPSLFLQEASDSLAWGHLSSCHLESLASVQSSHVQDSLNGEGRETGVSFQTSQGLEDRGLVSELCVGSLSRLDAIICLVPPCESLCLGMTSTPLTITVDSWLLFATWISWSFLLRVL